MGSESETSLEPLIPALRDLLAWLEASGVPGAIVGAVGASLQGRARTTGDIDAVLWLRSGGERGFLESGRSFGFVPRIDDALAFARKSRVLLLRHEPTATAVDLFLGILPFEEELIARAVPIQAAGLRIPTATAEDLIVMKALAGRPRDVADIENLLLVNPQLDLRRVRKQVRELSGLLEMPEIIENLERIVAGVRKTRPRKPTARRGASRTQSKKKKPNP